MKNEYKSNDSLKLSIENWLQNHQKLPSDTFVFIFLCVADFNMPSWEMNEIF